VLEDVREYLRNYPETKFKEYEFKKIFLSPSLLLSFSPSLPYLSYTTQTPVRE
jgi:hypothetical protein